MQEEKPSLNWNNQLLKKTALPEKPGIYAIGHSTKMIEEFPEVLFSFNIKILAHFRRLPGSRKYPQFDQDALKKSLEENGIKYIYLEKLGGRRPAQKDSKNTIWRNKSCQGYADYIETELLQMAPLRAKATTAMMCSEALWRH